MTHNTLDYATRIRQSGYRLTPQRKLILDAVCEGYGHTTLDEVYTRVQAKASTVNLTTVYRTLDFLCDIRLVVRAHVGKQTYYEIAGAEPHHHLICRHCGHEEELSNQMVEWFFIQLKQRYQFTIDSDHLTLFGPTQRPIRFNLIKEYGLYVSLHARPLLDFSVHHAQCGRLCRTRPQPASRKHSSNRQYVGCCDQT